MARTSDRDQFIKKLEKLGGSDCTFVSNLKLREELKWDEQKYRAVHSLLLQEDKIVVRRGRGGLVALASEKGAKILKVFISYSHVDTDLKTDLLKHLRPLEREGLIEVWADHCIPAGDDLDKEILKKLKSSDMVLALISIDFINSKYCYEIEMESALEREVKGEIKIVPIILRSCLWRKSPLARLKALPTDGKAATTWSSIDEALTIVAGGVRESAISFLQMY